MSLRTKVPLSLWPRAGAGMAPQEPLSPLMSISLISAYYYGPPSRLFQLDAGEREHRKSADGRVQVHRSRRQLIIS